jgi:thiamine biosynthesis protein ThiI
MNLIARFDEIFLKGKNQSIFVRQMIKNLTFLFSGTSVKRTEGGLLIFDFPEDKKELNRLTKMPGIAKFSPCQIIGNDYENIKAEILKMKFAENIKTFRITANRSWKNYPKKSMEINCELGEMIMDKFGLTVDLHQPDINIFVDIGAKNTLIYHEVFSGIGGLPTGSAGRVLCLLSGGIDSPVAGYALMKRGAEISFVHFQNETQVSEEVSAKIIDLVKVLAQYQPKIKLFIVPFKEYQKEIIMKILSPYRMISSRRVMFKLAEVIAQKNKCLALASGDSLAQVASQTLENMGVIYQATKMLKIAPLVGNNKSEIIVIAREIGTLGISERPYEDCCSLLSAKHPETKADLDKVLKMEKNFNLISLDKVSVMSYNISIT